MVAVVDQRFLIKKCFIIRKDSLLSNRIWVYCLCYKCYIKSSRTDIL